MPPDMSLPAEFAMTSERRGMCHYVAASGELDLFSAPSLECELRRVEQTDAETITVDLSGLTFMDSAGLHLLCRADLRSRTNGPRLRLGPASPAVWRMLELVGMGKDLPFDTPQSFELSAGRCKTVEGEAERAGEHQDMVAR